LSNEEKYLQRYWKHNKEFLDFFSKSEASDLLVVYWKKGSGSADLCSSFGEPLPVNRFPHAKREL